MRNPMTTAEISRMGFTNIILLDADRWRAEDGSIEAAAAAAALDIHYCFGMKDEPVDSVVAENRERMEVCSFAPSETRVRLFRVRFRCPRVIQLLWLHPVHSCSFLPSPTHTSQEMLIGGFCGRGDLLVVIQV
jgi:hypothetical protein